MHIDDNDDKSVGVEGRHTWLHFHVRNFGQNECLNPNTSSARSIGHFRVNAQEIARHGFCSNEVVEVRQDAQKANRREQRKPQVPESHGCPPVQGIAVCKVFLARDNTNNIDRDSSNGDPRTEFELLVYWNRVMSEFETEFLRRDLKRKRGWIVNVSVSC